MVPRRTDNLAHGKPQLASRASHSTPLCKEPASPEGGGLNQAMIGGADALLLGVAILGYVTIHELVQQLVE